MKTATELTKQLNCTWYKLKIIAKKMGWEPIRQKDRTVMYDLTDDDIAEFKSRPSDIIEKDYTLDLYKITLGWKNEK